MSFEFRPGRYYHAMWHAELAPVPGATSGCTHGGNLVALLWKEDHEQDWHLQYRFRYFRDGKIKDSEDEKVWYDGLIRNRTVENMVQGVQFMLGGAVRLSSKLVQGFEPKIDCLLIEGDADAFFLAVEREKPRWITMTEEGHWHAE